MVQTSHRNSSFYNIIHSPETLSTVCKLDWTKKSLLYMAKTAFIATVIVITLWNILSWEIRMSPILLAFCKALKTWICTQACDATYTKGPPPGSIVNSPDILCLYVLQIKCFSCFFTVLLQVFFNYFYCFKVILQF